MNETMICPITDEPCMLRPVLQDGLDYWITYEEKLRSNVQAYKEARLFSWRGIIYGLILISGKPVPDEVMIPYAQQCQESYRERLATTCVRGICTVRQQILREFDTDE